VGENDSAGYASTLINGGRPTESVLNKPWKNSAPLGRFTKNHGIADRAVTGVCALNFLNELLRRHHGIKHESPEAQDYALRVDMLADVGDEARDMIASFDENATWDALVVHFLQHCGPPDILAGVYSMLEEAHSEEIERPSDARRPESLASLLQFDRSSVSRQSRHLASVHPRTEQRGAPDSGQTSGADIPPYWTRKIHSGFQHFW
jgi:hypothetical protein